MNYVGNYKSHECKVELTDVELADAGKWQCTVEGYGFWTRGDIVSAEINLDVIEEKKQEVTVKPITTTLTLTSTDNTEVETKSDFSEGNSASLWYKNVYHNITKKFYYFSNVSFFHSRNPNKGKPFSHDLTSIERRRYSKF